VWTGLNRAMLKIWTHSSRLLYRCIQNFK